MRTIETQLVQHIESQKKLRQAEIEQQQLDPWDISSRKKQSLPPPPTDEVFYSFDLNSDYQNGLPTKSRSGGTIFSQHQLRSAQLSSRVQLGEGVGLQQLSPSLSPSTSPQNMRRAQNKPKTDNNLEDELCRYTLILSGVTLVLLEANPIHTYSQLSGRALQESDVFSSVQSQFSTSSSSLEYCSMDEGGLDPVKYFESVHDILCGRVTRYDVMKHQEQLGRVLPTDHLL